MAARWFRQLRFRRWLSLQVGNRPLWINLVIYLLVLVMGAGVSWFVYQSAHSLNIANQQLADKELPRLSQLAEARHQLSEYERFMYEFYATESEQVLFAKLSLTESKIELATENLNRNFPNEVAVARFRKALVSLEHLPQDLRRALEPGKKDWDTARKILIQATEYGQHAQDELSTLTEITQNKFSHALNNSQLRLSAVSRWVMAFSVAIVLMALAFGGYINQTLRQNYEKRRLALFIEKSPNAIACFNQARKCQFVNGSWRRFGFKNNETLASMLDEMLVKSQTANLRHQRTIRKIDGQVFEFSIQHINALAQTMVHVENVSEREEAKSTLLYQASHDELTGHYNLRRLRQDLNTLQSKNVPALALMLSIKRLKLISMTHGHRVGNLILHAVSKKLNEAVKDNKIPLTNISIYKVEGTNFCLLAKGEQKFPKQQLVQKLTQFFERFVAASVITTHGNFFIDYAVAICHYPSEASNGDDLFKHLNATLLSAGTPGRDKVIGFDESIGKIENRRLQLESALRHAKKDEEFTLVYQPKVALPGGHLSSLEALIRWQQPELGFVSPAEFIPIAEESGFIIRIGEWVINEACRQLALWKKDDIDVQVAVNISPTHLLSAGFVEFLAGQISYFQLDPSVLEIEMTEEAYATDKDALLLVLKEISEMGIGIAIDDFGTGYSSLSYLSQLPVSTLKIDRAFVSGLDSRPVNQAIVSTIVNLARSMRMKVVAEGIEREEEAKLLSKFGCDIGQGYWYAKPLSVDQLEAHQLIIDHCQIDSFVH